MILFRWYMKLRLLDWSNYSSKCFVKHDFSWKLKRDGSVGLQKSFRHKNVSHLSGYKYHDNFIHSYCIYSLDNTWNLFKSQIQFHLSGTSLEKYRLPWWVAYTMRSDSMESSLTIIYWHFSKLSMRIEKLRPMKTCQTCQTRWTDIFF